MNIYFFQWVSNLGGADTRLRDLIQCLAQSGKFNLFSVPNNDHHLDDDNVVQFYKEHNVKILTWQELPAKMDGIAVSFCNFPLFDRNAEKIKHIKSSGLKFIWSNDMMWRTVEEKSAISDGLIDCLIYTSSKHLEDTGQKSSDIKQKIIPNYLYLNNYKYINREINDIFTIGKHSRSDSAKFSDHFPLFYQNLNLKNPRYSIMGVNQNIKRLFEWYDFADTSWQLLPTNAKPVQVFLSSLDAYVYNSKYSFTETFCRATVEAMLTGLPIVVPDRFNFKQQVRHGHNGFLCSSYEDYRKYTQTLETSPDLRIELGKNGRDLSKKLWCDEGETISAWERLFKEAYE